MRRITLGLIGLGYWGANYLRVLLQLNEVRLKLVCDKETKKLMDYAGLASKSSINFTDDLAKVTRDEELEAVIIATPASTHYEIAKKMLEAGKHVLVEKPLTMNYEQALELSHLSERMSRVLMVGHIYCFNPAVNYMKDVLSSNKLGKLYYGIGLRLGLGPIRNDASCTWDLATHDIAMLDYLLNKMPSSVSAHGLSFLQKEKGIHDYAAIQLNYDNDFKFSLIVSWYAAEKTRMWYLMGSKGMIKFDDINKSASVTIYNKSVTFSTDLDVIPSVNKVMPIEGDIIIPYIQQSEPLLLENRHFIECIKAGKKPLTDSTQGARVVKVLEAIEESIRNNGKTVFM
jgi:predicted dehydrogenase